MKMSIQADKNAFLITSQPTTTINDLRFSDAFVLAVGDFLRVGVLCGFTYFKPSSSF